MPKLFVDLVDAHLDAPALTRVLTLLQDAMTSRLLELAVRRRGEPPVPYAWLAFGSAARSELTLASDQDNGLAYADTDDPAVDEYFRVLALDVNSGLRRCGFSLDPHGTVASNSPVAPVAVDVALRARAQPAGRRSRPPGARQRLLRLPPGRRRAGRRSRR